MKNCISAFLAIVGTVIGSGFISGKEILVFFSRFGIISFPCIILAFFLFFFLFKFILEKGDKALQRIHKNKIPFFINIFLCLVFSSAMFAGIGNVLSFNLKIFNYIIFFIIILLSAFVFKKGMGGLNKLNFLLVPLMCIVLFIALIFSIEIKPIEVSNSLSGLSVFYAILYCVMNTSHGGVMIATFAKDLTKRQKTQVAFFSALALSVMLLLADIVLLQNPSSFEQTMPLLSLFSGSGGIIMTFIVFLGCLTTLLTLVFTLSSSMRGLCNNEILIFFVSILLPLVFSLLGFDFLVEYLYPLASVFGIYILYELLRKGSGKSKNLRKVVSNEKHLF